ncbi:MAG TPA: hypothetical protein PKC19_23530, partial [Roseiflexaceae bacterium]|nr:hypothetical protein [Roseiflexaceae bacterium]
MSEIPTPQTYLTDPLPTRFAAATAAATAEIHNQPELLVAYSIEADPPVTCWYRIAEGTLTVSQEPIAPCDMRISIGEPSWRAAVAHGSNEWFIDYYLRGKID